MATAYIREYADTSQETRAQAPQEPSLASYTISTSGSSAASQAFSANTRLVAIATPAAQAVSVEFSQTRGASPTADANSLRLPANSLVFFGVRPGDKLALIDVT